MNRSKKVAFSLLATYSTYYMFKSSPPGCSAVNVDSTCNGPTRAIVIGGGVAGVSSAHRLACKGLDVAIIDTASSHGGVSEECSKVSAGGMQRMSTVVDKSYWIHTISGLLSSLSPFETPEGDFKPFRISLVSTITDLHFWRWLYDFSRSTLLNQSDKEKLLQRKSAAAFTNWAIDCTQELMESGPTGDLGKIAGFSRCGAVQLIQDIDKLRQLKAQSTPTWQVGNADYELSVVLSQDELLEHAPWLAHSPMLERSCGGLYQVEAARANSHWFTRGLADDMVSNSPKSLASPSPSPFQSTTSSTIGPLTGCKRSGQVAIFSNTRVTDFETVFDNDTNSHRITLISTNQGKISVDPDTVIVVAAGSWTPLILRHLGLYCPQYPLKGYDILINNSMTKSMNQSSKTNCPSPRGTYPIVAAGHTYMSRFDRRDQTKVDKSPYATITSQLRVASVGEFAGWNTTPSPVIAKDLKKYAKYILPEDMNSAIDSADVVCGLRPFVADGVPLIGPLPRYSNLFVNTGPGFNGWKIAVGAAEVLARSVTGESMDQSQKEDQQEGFQMKSFKRGSVDDHKVPFDQSIFSPLNRVKYSPIFTSICQFFGSWK